MQTRNFKGDIRDTRLVEDWIERVRPTHLFHLAARVPVSEVERDPVEALGVNAFGTYNVLDGIRKHSPKAWIFIASTSHVYRNSTLPVSEVDEIAPQTTYGETKYLAEQIAQFFGRNTGARVCIGRIFSFYHPTQRKPFLYPSIVERLAEHDRAQVFVLKGGEDVRDIMSADDVVENMIKLMAIEHTGTINIGTGRGTSIHDFVARMGGEGLRIQVVQERTATTLVADISKLKELFGE
jgi:nucleoside-diphosphate-sugar epimerase